MEHQKEVPAGYQIPEAFTFDGKELSGYWAMKYTAGEESAPTFDTEVAATSSSIKAKGVTGTKVVEGQTYKYYLNGEYKGEKTSANDWFEYTGLSAGTKYTILVEIRNASDEYVGTVVKQISTIEANKTRLKPDSMQTAHITWNTIVVETKSRRQNKKQRKQCTKNWYDYSNSKWANIVVKSKWKRNLLHMDTKIRIQNNK